MSDQNSRTSATGLQREAARRKAQDHFTAAEKRDTEVRQEIARQQAATAAQTAKLRALRLAKEEADRAAAASAPASAPVAPKTRKKRSV
jgi:hypothetical protein